MTPRLRDVKRAVRASRVSAPERRLRCWEDRKGHLHIGCNLAGGAQLVEAVSRLAALPEPTSVTLALDATPFPEAKNPVWQRGVARVLAQLRIQRVDDPMVVRELYAHRADTETAEVQVGVGYLDDFLTVLRRVAAGDGDFSVGGRPPGVSARRWRQETTLDRDSADLWFWGQYNVHCTNTF